MGTIDVAYNVDATALFYSRPTPDMSDLITDLNGRLSKFDEIHMQMSPLSHDDWWLLSCKDFHIMIAFSDSPSRDPRMTPASKAAVCDLKRFDYPQVVQSHQAHLHIEVGDGTAPLPPEARTIMQEFGEGSSCDPKLKMMALHWTAQFIARHVGFLALHFGPSDRLFSPEEVAECAKVSFPTPLLMHPVPSMPEPGPNGVDGYHIRLKNPQFLDGPSIALEGLPVSIPLRTAVTLLNTLYKARNSGRVTLEHGKVIKPSAKLALYAREENASAEAPNGEIVLSFWKDRGHAVTRKVTSTEPVPEKTQAIEVEAKQAEPRADLHDDVQIEDSHPDQAFAADTIIFTPAAMQSDPHDLADELSKRVDEKIGAQPDKVADRLEDLPDEHVVARARTTRRGPHMWLLNTLRKTPFDSRAKIAGLAIIAGLQVFWAPYNGFTGGLSADANAAGTASVLPAAAHHAFLTE